MAPCYESRGSVDAVGCDQDQRKVMLHVAFREIINEQGWAACPNSHPASLKPTILTMDRKQLHKRAMWRTLNMSRHGCSD